MFRTADILLLGASAFALSACGAGDRLASVGKAPEQTVIENPLTSKEYNHVSMPMPAPQPEIRQFNSLWSSNRQQFFDDQRADDVGDILTIMVNISDTAALENETERRRNTIEDSDLPNFLGYEGQLLNILPDEVNPSSLVQAQTLSQYLGEGTTEREEEIEIEMAATVTQILPNGNLVIYGRQEVRVNFENRVVQIAGVIRPEDVSINNTISHTQIAEARIVYGGEGQITDMQQPRYGQQVYDILFPF